MKLKSFVIENLPSILTGVAVAGVVETVILAVKATPKALAIIEEKKIKKTRKAIFKETWRCYIPTAAVGVGTMACIVGANHVHLTKEAGMLAAYSMVGHNFAEYRERSGEKHDKKIMKAIEDEKVSKAISEKPKEDLEIGKMWFYEPVSEQYFQATTEQILWAELQANHKFKDQEWLSFNQFLDFLPEVDRVPWGDHTGWYTYDEDGVWDWNWSFVKGSPWISIKPYISKDDEVMVIGYSLLPDDCPDPHDIEEPEQINMNKPVVVKS